MKYIKIFENYGNKNPEEEEVYNDIDGYFLSLNPNLMKITGYNTYSHHVKERKKENFRSTYAIETSKSFGKTPDELYEGLYLFLLRKNYDVRTYSPILNDGQRKASELVARINLSRYVHRGGEYGRAMWIRCSSGKSICFYFSPGTDVKWWPEVLSVHRFDDRKMVSVYWTEVDKNSDFSLVFWNGSDIIDGKFSITYDYDYDEIHSSYDNCGASCDSASDSLGYTATVKIPEGESDPEDVINISRK
jgi:hypothetical protein